MRRLFNAALLLSLFVTTGRAQTIVYDNGPAINAYGELIGGGGWNYGADFSFNEFTRFDGIRFSSYQYGLGPPTNWYWYIRDASWQLLASGTGYSQQMQIYPACCYAPYRYQNDLTISELGLSAGRFITFDFMAAVRSVMLTN